MTEIQTPLAKNGDPQQAIQRMSVQDDSQFANLMDTARYDQMLRVSAALAASTIIPAHFQKNPANCFIALQMATRLGVDVFMFMQNTYVVHGKPGMQATLAIALMNSSGLFVDPIDYEVEGNDPFKDNYRVRAFATRKSTNKAIYGPWVDWRTVRAEKWDKKDGSKWLTLPGLMFNYRAAAFFGRLHCPERLMGMLTAEELDDVTPTRRVESVVTSRPSVPMPKATDEPAETTDDAEEVERLRRMTEEKRAASQSPQPQPDDATAEPSQNPKPTGPAAVTSEDSKEGAMDDDQAAAILAQERFEAKTEEAWKIADLAGMKQPAFESAMKRTLKGREKLILSDKDWAGFFEAIKERRGNFA